MIRALHFVSFHPTVLSVSRWDVRTLVSQEITQRHLLGLLLGSYRAWSVSGQNALAAQTLRQNPMSLAAAHKRLAQYIRAQYVPTHVCGCLVAERCALGCRRQEEVFLSGECCFRKSAGRGARVCLVV